MSNLLFILFVWMIGACFGSFFMVIGLRVPIGQSIIHPRSTCSHCHHYLGPFELIPVFSYFIQKGHCHHCHTKLSILYPLTETLTGLLFVLGLLSFLNQPKEMVFIFFLIAFGSIFCTSDLTYFLLPDSLMFYFFSFIFVSRLWFHPLPLANYFITGLSFFLFFYAFYYFTNEGIGGGDVKLFGILGLYFGFELSVLMLFIACLSLLLTAWGFICINKISRQTRLPFAPFIFFSSFFVALYGTNFLSILYSFFYSP